METRTLTSVCVFCGANSGNEAVFVETARKVGVFLAENQLKLVYGGGKVGMMGAVADGALEKGGQVVGVIPFFLDHREVIHPDVSEMIILNNMHERKARIYELSDAFVALPGGYGTMDEIFEIITWAQLGLHQKPIGILNVEGFYDHFVQLLDGFVQRGFVKPHLRGLIVDAPTWEELWDKLLHFESPETEDWLKKVSET